MYVVGLGLHSKGPVRFSGRAEQQSSSVPPEALDISVDLSEIWRPAHTEVSTRIY